jgi:hypothetical protein
MPTSLKWKIQDTKHWWSLGKIPNERTVNSIVFWAFNKLQGWSDLYSWVASYMFYIIIFVQYKLKSIKISNEMMKLDIFSIVEERGAGIFL